jgi:hypothetical protein
MYWEDQGGALGPVSYDAEPGSLRYSVAVADGRCETGPDGKTPAPATTRHV